MDLVFIVDMYRGKKKNKDLRKEKEKENGHAWYTYMVHSPLLICLIQFYFQFYFFYAFFSEVDS